MDTNKKYLPTVELQKWTWNIGECLYAQLCNACTPASALRIQYGGAKTQVKDMFGFEMITQNKSTTAQIDKNTWTEERLDLLMAFIRTDERAAEFRGLDWTREYDLARNGDPNDTQAAL